MITTISSLFSDGSAAGGLALPVLLGLFVAFLVATRLVGLVVGVLSALAQFAMTLGVVGIVIGGIGIFAGLLTLYNASQGSGY